MSASRMPLSINDEIPKSRITLTYRTAAGGELEDVVLPFRLLLMGDFSNGKSKDRQVDLDQRSIRNLDGTNLDEVMKDMDMSFTFTVPNRVDAQTDAVDVTLPVTSMKSFTPAQIAENFPKVKSLLLLRKLLLEVQANLDNHKGFRKLVRVLAKTKNAEELQKELAGLGDFNNFKVPELRTPSSEEGDDDAPTSPPEASTPAKDATPPADKTPPTK